MDIWYNYVTYIWYTEPHLYLIVSIYQLAAGTKPLTGASSQPGFHQRKIYPTINSIRQYTTQIWDSCKHAITELNCARFISMLELNCEGIKSDALSNIQQRHGIHSITNLWWNETNARTEIARIKPMLMHCFGSSKVQFQHWFDSETARKHLFNWFQHSSVCIIVWLPHSSKSSIWFQHNSVSIIIWFHHSSKASIWSLCSLVPTSVWFQTSLNSSDWILQGSVPALVRYHHNSVSL